MSGFGPDGRVDLQDLRVKLYDLLGYRYSAVSPSPGALILLQAANILPSSSDPIQCRGRIRGVGFNGKRISVQEVRAGSGDAAFDGLIISISHSLSIYGRTVVLPGQGDADPRHIDGMKRVEFPADRIITGYAAYADNQVEGRSLVSAEFAKRLRAIADGSASTTASAAFAGRQMHVVLPIGGAMRFSDGADYTSHAKAAEQIARDMAAMFELAARVDALHTSADRYVSAEQCEAQAGYYAAKIKSVAPLISAAMDAGIVTDSRRAKYLTREAAITNPALQGMILSGA